MNLANVLYGLYILVALYGICITVGYGFESGRQRATKHRKVCDICFRDIKRWNKAYKEALVEALPNKDGSPSNNGTAAKLGDSNAK
jgi:hypothetical protein